MFSVSLEKQVQRVLKIIGHISCHDVGSKPDGWRLLTKRAQEVEAKIATALLPVQVCAVAPLRKVNQPTPSSNSARATVIPVPARDMLSFRSIVAQAESPPDINLTQCKNPRCAPTTSLSPSPLAKADTRTASGEGGRARRFQGRAGQGGSGRGRSRCVRTFRGRGGP